MKIKMTLVSDAVFGNGESIPGGEDISVLHDRYGFPYYKGGTLKGIFREELTNYLIWNGKEIEADAIIDQFLGSNGDDQNSERKLRFSDLEISENVKAAILKEMIDGKTLSASDILNAFSYIRTFTAIDENGIAQDHSLRYVRCLKAGILFFGEIGCRNDDEGMVAEVLRQIKWAGTMRNRGFGKVCIERI